MADAGSGGDSVAYLVVVVLLLSLLQTQLLVEL